MLSIIVPVYNERDSLLILFDKILDVMTSLKLAWEVVFVDDGSTDGSTDVLLRLQANYDNVTVAVQRRNFGKSKGLAVGFCLARGDIVMTMDADLQDDPAEIPNLLAKLNQGYDVVSGWKQNRQDPLSKTIPSWIANTFTTLLTGVKLKDMNSGLKMYRADCVRSLTLYGDLHRYIPVLAYDAGFKITEIPVKHHKRQFGKSKYGPGRLISGGLDLLTVLFLTRYSRKPLHLFGSIGGIMLLAGLGINLILTIQWFQGFALSERPLLFLGVLLMVVGVQLLTMGLIAELLVSYIQRQDDPLQTLKQVYRGRYAQTDQTKNLDAQVDSRTT
ncbi:MAG: glycosyltransferase [Phototrophicales bacterium]|nr:MAG: glycosyltransferase [Phototrophicales bacterium]RMG73300.1 MAG: glycosyltransferase [Chloroflexota bacterium]